jgi:hypothetical protein
MSFGSNEAFARELSSLANVAATWASDWAELIWFAKVMRCSPCSSIKKTGFTVLPTVFRMPDAWSTRPARVASRKSISSAPTWNAGRKYSSSESPDPR